ncbi:ABC transporter ATP-binding protein [Leifsonia sp. 2MCAF36]|uniref:ABC transporter ATP-binding protein n=1 Tax=Leifsonia sp. 2MCAF36 TaxID=3232988 RepID=UPI003F9DA804
MDSRRSQPPSTSLTLGATARSLRVRHDGAAAWMPDGVDVEVAPGEVLLVLGPSGSGKSSFAMTFNGLIPHALPADVSGTMTVAGIPTSDATIAELSLHVGMVFQQPDAQLIMRTLLDEVCFGPENLLVPAAEVKRRAEAALRAVGLWERRDDDPDLLSGGGQQRLAIACALALEAPLMVLDEPTSNLDPAGAEEVYRLLGRLTGPESPRSVVLVEHDLDLALEIADSVLVLDRVGRPFAQGPAREVLRTQAEELEALGVWLPTPTTAALRMRRAGIPVDPLPLDAAELTAALSGVAVDGLREASGGSTAEPEEAGGGPAITVSRLTLTRAGRRVLDDLSLHVESGDFFAIVGPNGAGKSTLAQVLAGILRAPRGTVDVLGLDPTRAPRGALRQAIGFVFQNPEHQFVAHTVVDELAVGLRARRLPDDEVDSRVERMLDLLDLDPLRASHPFRLSGGEKRRLSVGTALIEGAPLLVLDEPTFGQDRARATALLDTLAALNASGTTVVAITHDLALVGEYARHVAILDAGRIVAMDETARILADRELLEAHALRQPPLVRALRAPSVPHPLHGLTRLADLPGSG